MIEINTLFQILIAVLAILVLIKELKPKKKPKNDEIEKIYRAMALIAKHPYEKRNIMSHKHYEHYRKLKEYADENNLIICPKVHMVNLLLPEQECIESKRLKELINNFVDFALCTQDMTVVKIIMIKKDGSDLEKALIEFYEKMFSEAGHEIVFTNEITDEILRFQ